MNNFFRAIIAGYGAKKLGGGCFGTIIVFVIIWVALGQCSFSSREVPPPETYPANRRAEVFCPSPPVSVVVGSTEQVDAEKPDRGSVHGELACKYLASAMACVRKNSQPLYFVS